jgi:hypothetical protein
MQVGKMYVSSTGEAFRVIEVADGQIHLSTFESDFVLNGEIDNFTGLMQASGMVEIQEKEYKLRVVAMRAFQDMKGDKDYPYKKSYLGQYDEMKGFMSNDSIDSFFELGGGFRDYSKEEPTT